MLRLWEASEAPGDIESYNVWGKTKSDQPNPVSFLVGRSSGSINQEEICKTPVGTTTPKEDPDRLKTSGHGIHFADQKYN